MAKSFIITMIARVQFVTMGSASDLHAYILYLVIVLGRLAGDDLLLIHIASRLVLGSPLRDTRLHPFSRGDADGGAVRGLIVS